MLMAAFFGLGVYLVLGWWCTEVLGGYGEVEGWGMRCG